MLNYWRSLPTMVKTVSTENVRPHRENKNLPVHIEEKSRKSRTLEKPRDSHKEKEKEKRTRYPVQNRYPSRVQVRFCHTFLQKCLNPVLFFVIGFVYVEYHLISDTISVLIAML